MHIIAHRGVSAHYHENTIESFKKALELDVYGIEVDLHEVEHQFVIFHDFQLQRLTQQSGEVADLTLTQLNNIRLKDGSKIPMLSELFELTAGKCVLNLEIKRIDSPSLLLKQITLYIEQYKAQVVISSFNHPLLNEFQLLVRNTPASDYIRFGALVAHLPLSLAQYAVDMHVDIAAIDAELVTSEFVEHAHMYNMEVWVYTVNFEKGFKHLNSIGVDAVFTNDPALFLNREK